MRTPHQYAYVNLANIVGKELLEKELSLLTTKLYDYQYTNPVDATQQFLDAFIKTHKSYWAKTRDLYESVNKPGVSERKLLSNKPSVISALWQGRQVADSIGCRYDSYIITAFEYLVSEKIWQRLPQPNQIYSEEIIEHVAEQWNATSGSFPIPTDPRFQISPISDTFIHRMFRNYVVESYKQKSTDLLPQFVAWNLLEKNLFSEAQVAEAFGDDFLERAKRYVSDEQRPEPPRGLFEYDFLPSCYGVPYTTQMHTCSECGFASVCKSAALETVELIIAECGDEDPKLQRKRELARKRKQRQREKEKAKRQRDIEKAA